jgi:hypothetical protein
MFSRASRVFLLAVILAGLAAAGGVVAYLLTERPSGPGDGSPGDVRLVVLVVFDQMRGDYLERWGKLMDKDGFQRLQRDGAWFKNCHYPYAYTETAQGHASMATGCSPRTHGIIGNRWYDRASGKRIVSVHSEGQRPVPMRDKPGEAVGGGTPERRLAPSVGESLITATNGKGKVVSLSFKDRAAILLAALAQSLCFWFNLGTGIFETSTYYGRELPPWVQRFNQAEHANQWLGKSWDRLRPSLDYDKFSGPDNFAEEGRPGSPESRVFPHPMSRDLKKSPSYYDTLYASPFGNDLLLELAKRAIDAEELGKDDTPDLLCISFSCNDVVGHAWGPDSHEVLDTTLRSDRIMKDLLEYLDDRVGKGRYLVVVCADHGICPLPSKSRQQGKDADRIDQDQLVRGVAGYLDERFGKAEKDNWVASHEDGYIYLNEAVLKKHGLPSHAVEEALAGWLVKQKGILSAYTRTQLSKGPLTNDPIGEKVRQTFHPQRSGDVVAILKPYHLFAGTFTTGTSHGSPHPYDTHVPLLVYGPGVKTGVHEDAVTPLAVAPIVARGLRVPPPGMAEVVVPEGLMK